MSSRPALALLLALAACLKPTDGTPQIASSPNLAADAFVVIVSGGEPMRPMLSGDDKELTPWATSGAIWIDANGDGKSLARGLVRR